MKNKNILSCLLATVLFLCGGSMAKSQTGEIDTMRRVTYIPAEFHTVELQLGLSGTGPNVCTPYYNDFSMYMNRSGVLIHVPRRIVCSSPDSLIIPLCGAYSITYRRGLKYADSTTTVHIKKIGDTAWYSGEIHDASYYDPSPIAYPPFYREQEEKRQQEIKKAQEYSDEELEQEGTAGGGSFDVNVLDYIKTPLTPGIYEVYLTLSGLESNRVQVEIVFSSDCDVMSVHGDQSTSTVMTGNDKPNDPSVHIAGFEKNAHIYVAKHWNNGLVQPLSDENGCYAWANDVFVLDDDVYIAGCEYNAEGRGIVRLWKNGLGQSLTDGASYASAKSIYLSDGDVYIAGEEGWQAALWKNGIVQKLADGDKPSDATSVYVSNKDVFVAINQRNAQGKLVAKLWKNGVLRNLSDGSVHASAQSVFVSGKDVYVAGGEQNAQGRYSAKLWKNGMEQELDSLIGNDYSFANSVFVSEDDVYVAGYEYNAVGRCVARLWKNGKAYHHTDGTGNAWALSVFVSKGDVYVSGHGYDDRGKPVAVLWKKGVPEYLTDGNNQAEATSVYVK